MNARLHTHLKATPATSLARTSLRRNFESGSRATASLLQKAVSSPGQTIKAGTRAVMEPQFGYNFSRVRIHADGAAAKPARAVIAVPSVAPLTLQRSARFVDGSVTKPLNLAERLVKGERDAGNTDFVLNGTAFSSTASGDTLRK